MMATTKSTGGLQAFLDSLRAFESGIDPERHAWYVENFQRPVLTYPPVRRPGQVARDDATGGYTSEPCTVEEYFRRLGILAHFDPEDPGSLVAMQYRSINALGYVGYQVGEAVLIDTGFYQPPRVTIDDQDATITARSFYVGGLDDSIWRHGRTQVVHRDDETGETLLATHVNEWQGQFTGRGGVHSFADLRTQACQERIIRAILTFNSGRLRDRLAEKGVVLEELLDAGHAPDAGPRLPSGVTLSGVLAAAHLCGAYGAADGLVRGHDPSDEFGTSMHSYMQRFSGFDVSLADVLDS